MANIPVKWFTGSMQGAPSCGPTTPGSLISVLDACLINGFNSKTLASLVVVDEVATATVTGGHGYLANQVVLIAGATPAGLNGEWRVTAVPSTTTFTFSCPGVSDGSASGTITAKTAPVGGWVKEFSATNKAVYRSANANSPRSFYRFDDTSGANAACTLQAFVSMSDVDTGTDEWTDGLAVTAKTWWKPGTASQWQVIADDRTVYFWIISAQYGASGGCCYYLGDYASIDPNDVDAEFCYRQGTSGYHSNFLQSIHGGADTQYSCMHLRKDEYGSFGGYHYGWRQLNDVSGNGGPSFPSSVDGGMMLSNAWLRENGNNSYLRGLARGVYWVCADQPFSIAADPAGRDISGVAGLEGRTLRVLSNYAYSTGTTYFIGRAAYDITGPWD